VSGFTVDREYMKTSTLCDRPVVPFEEVARHFPPSEYRAFVAVGYHQLNKLRESRLEKIKRMGYKTVSFVHPSADIMGGVSIGANCFIGPFVQIQFSTTIKDNVIVGTGTVIGHDVNIHKSCFIGVNSTIPGNVTIHDYCLIAPGSTLRNKINIASESIIGIGSIILDSTQEQCVFVGQKAERLDLSSRDLPLV
jgi:sugar O-acyltransferase (sialic acid O-acetyltransferase NeuD family)